MPCQDGGPDYGASRLNEVTQNLCFLCGQLEDRDMFGSFSNPRLSAWWAEHQRRDLERVSGAMGLLLAQRPGDFPSHLALAQRMIDEAERVHPVSAWHKRWFLRVAQDVYQRNQDIRAKRESGWAKLTEDERKALNIHWDDTE